jgi:homoserine dehydrogenase
MKKDAVKVGLIGLGTVGGGVAKTAGAGGGRYSRLLGAPLVLARAVDLDPARAADLGLKPPLYTPMTWTPCWPTLTLTSWWS